MCPSSAFLGGLGMLHFGSKKLEKPVFLLCFLCEVAVLVLQAAAVVVAVVVGGWSSAGRRWLVVGRSSEVYGSLP